MEIIKQILTPALVFVVLGVIMGALLAAATKLFRVEVDEKAEAISACLPGANCGGCGYAGCAALAEAVAKGEAKVNACTVGGSEVASKIAEIMGVEAGEAVRMRAQVICCGTHDNAKKKYIYDGAADCAAAARLGGGDKMCPNGCIGLGTCAANCPFDAIVVDNGIAAVDSAKCQGCGVCVSHCPKGVIKLIPFDAKVWVGCNTREPGKKVRVNCEAGCIGCKLCEKACPVGAVSVVDSLASIDYTKCTSCGACADKCPRGIIKQI